MTDVPYTTVMEPTLWVHIERILSRVPAHIHLGECRSNEEFIDALGRNGAFEALRAYLAALQEYHSDPLFHAVRAATHEPLQPFDRRRFGVDPFDDGLWGRMFDMSWCDESREEG